MHACAYGQKKRKGKRRNALCLRTDQHRPTNFTANIAAYGVREKQNNELKLEGKHFFFLSDFFLLSRWSLLSFRRSFFQFFSMSREEKEMRNRRNFEIGVNCLRGTQAGKKSSNRRFLSCISSRKKKDAIDTFSSSSSTASLTRIHNSFYLHLNEFDPVVSVALFLFYQLVLFRLRRISALTWEFSLIWISHRNFNSNKQTNETNKTEFHPIQLKLSLTFF